MQEMKERNGEKLPIIGNKKLPLLIVVCGLVIIIGLSCVIGGSIVYTRKEKHKEIELTNERVGVVVDAGGSGTRLIVYTYNGKDKLSQLKYIKCEKKGLATYTKDEFDSLKGMLTKCFNEGASNLPSGKKVPLYFAATGGMRLLKLTNGTVYKEIWSIVKECIAASIFNPMQSGTISGFDEAKFAWVAGNYLKRTLHGSDIFGTTELGSTSLQITFEEENSKKSPDIKTIVIDGEKKTIYAHSYLCFGMSEMERRFNAKLVKDANYTSLVINPCFGSGYSTNKTSDYLWATPCSSGDYAKNYLGEDISGPSNTVYRIEGSSNFPRCYAEIKELFDKKCNKSSCGINGEFQPRLDNVNSTFLAFGAFYHAGKFLKLGPSSNKADYLNATEAICKKPYVAKVANKYDYIQCLEASYGYYLLNDGFSFPDDWSIEFVKNIDGKKVGWPLGIIYMNKDKMVLRVHQHTIVLKDPIFLALIVIGICLLVSSALLIVTTCRTKRYERIE